jgi:galactonate dehydratase
VSCAGRRDGEAHRRRLLIDHELRQHHCLLSPIALAASIQLDACLPNFLVQEHNEVNDWREGGQTLIGSGYLASPFVLDAEGCVAVLQEADLGVEIDKAGFATIMQRPWSERRG